MGAEGTVLKSQGCPLKGRDAYPGVCPEGWEWVWLVAMTYVLCGRGHGGTSLKPLLIYHELVNL